MSDISWTPTDIDYLRSPTAIRERAGRLYQLAAAGGTHFEVHPEKLDDVADYVLAVIREHYPDLNIGYHSRWGHFQVGGVDRLAMLDQRLADLDPTERARCKLDLVVVSVLLDAGAGPDWRYTEGDKTFNRSEGLAVASLYLFLTGAFSSDKESPFRADADGLKALTRKTLEQGFQVSDDNPLVGVDGRLSLLAGLGETLLKHADMFPEGRPGNLIDHLTKDGTQISAESVLGAVLQGFGDIWPGRVQLGDTNMGDVWRHPDLGTLDSTSCLVPFHKLSQWMTYSLIEPMEEAGIVVNGVENLTGLAEYRNGGLLLDKGLISLRDPRQADRAHQPDSTLIIEWRALTIIALDQIAEKVRKALGLSDAEFPLAKVLEGGTWRAGRKAAAERREDHSPPLKLQSDGTVF